VGPCEGSFPQFYFDSITRQCESFVYGGCQGNPNRFDSLDQCQQRCQSSQTINEIASGQVPDPYQSRDPRGMCVVSCRCIIDRDVYLCILIYCCSLTDICRLPSSTGPCRAYIPSFYFDGTGCTSFIYGGCDGNDNRFPTEEECLHVCGQFVSRPQEPETPVDNGYRAGTVT